MDRKKLFARKALFTAILALAACGDDAPPPATTPDLGAADTGVPPCTTDAQCDDGMFCNGVARCTPSAAGADARGCVAATGSSCLASQTCNEATDACETACDTGGDADGDGIDAMSCGGTDCDDSDALTFPGNSEVCDADHDEDCNPTTFGPDGDSDGFAGTECCNGDACGADCDDTSDTVGPSGTESCNLVDDDCNGTIDEGVQTTCFVDADGDSYAAVGAAPMMACTCGAGFTATAPSMAADCNDSSITVNPAVPEVCNTIDDNCNGMIDEGLGTTYYRDLDGDGRGATASGTIVSCSMPVGYAAANNDCDDGCAACYTGAPDVCDALDNNCNGVIDEVLPAPCTVGVGACTRVGLLRCDGSCTTVPGIPDSSFHTTAAANGSWDWNCDGVVEPRDAITDPSYSSAEAFCRTQTCPSGSTPMFLPAVHRGALTTGSPSPFCGVTLWTVGGDGSGCSRPPSPSDACSNAYRSGTARQGCR